MDERYMKRLRLIILTIVLLCTIFIVLMLIVHKYLPAAASARIEAAIKSHLDTELENLYEFRVKGLEFSIFLTSFSISDIFLDPNEDILVETDGTRLPGNIYKVLITGFGGSTPSFVLLALGRKNIRFNDLSAESIFLRVYTNEDSSETPGKKTGNHIESLEFKSVKTEKINLEQRSLTDSSILAFHAEHTGFKGRIEFHNQVKDFDVNIRLYEHSFHAVNAGLLSSQGLHSLQFDSILLDGNKGTITLGELKIIPRYSKQDFHRHVSHETDRLEIFLKNIEVDGFDTNRALNEGVFAFSQIDIKGERIEIFRDRTPPSDEQKRPLMPVRLIHNASFGFYIKNIRLSETDLFYSELPEDAETPGTVPFTRLTASIGNLTNLPALLESDSIMNIKAHAHVFDVALLMAEFKYNLKDINGGFIARGELTGFDFEAINPALFPLTGIKIKEGTHKKAEFYFTGNDIESEGEITMYWSGLLIELAPERSDLIRGIARFAGRKFLYHQSNPANNEEVRSGKIEFERDTRRFVFHYWWNCYLSGIKDSVLRRAAGQVISTLTILPAEADHTFNALPGKLVSS